MEHGRDVSLPQQIHLFLRKAYWRKLAWECRTRVFETEQTMLELRKDQGTCSTTTKKKFVSNTIKSR